LCSGSSRYFEIGRPSADNEQAERIKKTKQGCPQRLFSYAFLLQKVLLKIQSSSGAMHESCGKIQYSQVGNSTAGYVSYNNSCFNNSKAYELAP